MAAPFATAADLTARGLTVADEALANQHLQDASEDLRGEIGWQVSPPVEVTVTVRPEHGRARLPGAPVVSVATVTDRDGTVLDPGSYELADGELRCLPCGPLTVTYTVGYTNPPAELVRWTCVLAAQSLARAAEEQLGGTPQAEALADYRITYSERQQLGELPIPRRVLDRLRATYGRSAYVA